MNGALSKEYIYLGSTLLATHEGPTGATLRYHHPDHLGTRVDSDTVGNWTRKFGHFPFGEVWYEDLQAGAVASKLKFTSYERDSESGLDQAVFRYDSSRLGRFMSPDPLAGALPRPQSLNRYAYVLNDAINVVDPLGLEGEDECHWECKPPDSQGIQECTWVCPTVVNVDGGPPPLVPPYDASRGSGPDCFADIIACLIWRQFYVYFGTLPQNEEKNPFNAQVIAKTIKDAKCDGKTKQTAEATLVEPAPTIWPTKGVRVETSFAPGFVPESKPKKGQWGTYEVSFTAQNDGWVKWTFHLDQIHREGWKDRKIKTTLEITDFISRLQKTMFPGLPLLRQATFD